MTTQFEIDCALMAGEVYISTRTDLNKLPTPPGWMEVPLSHVSLPSGFEAVSFAKGNEIVISYAGTYPPDLTGDWAANLGLGLGTGSIQLIQAARYYMQVKADNPNAQITFTGHSLGGAMAAILHARLDETDFHPFRHRPRHRISPATSCYTFGMPRYGDTSAKAVLPQPYHTYNELDAIPTLPPKLLGFADSANERCLNAIPEIAMVQSKGDFALRKGKGIATILGVSDHRMERYMERTNGMRH